MMRFGRVPSSEQHMLRFNRASDDHLLRFSKRAGDYNGNGDEDEEEEGIERELYFS